jgi:hypothetical protein
VVETGFFFGLLRRFPIILYVLRAFLRREFDGGASYVHRKVIFIDFIFYIYNIFRVYGSFHLVSLLFFFFFF